LEQALGGIGRSGPETAQGCSVSAVGWGRMTWTALERWTQSGCEARRHAMATNVSASNIASCLSALGSTSTWRASSFPLARIDPGVVADGPSDRCSWWRYRQIASYRHTVDVASPARLQDRGLARMVFTIQASTVRNRPRGHGAPPLAWLLRSLDQNMPATDRVFLSRHME